MDTTELSPLESGAESRTRTLQGMESWKSEGRLAEDNGIICYNKANLEILTEQVW